MLLSRYISANLICILIFFTANAIPQELTISPMTYEIVQRHYCITRLEKTVQLLLAMSYDSSTASLISYCLKHLDSCEEIVINNKKIIESLVSIRSSGSLNPLLKIWNNFISYHFLGDVSLVDDLAKAIFIITKSIVIAQNKQYQNRFNSFISQNNISYESMLSEIDNMTSLLSEESVTTNVRSNQDSILQDSHHDKSSVDDIALRFYYINRLKRSVEFITKNHIDSCEPYIDGNIIRTQWNDICCYKMVDDKNFMKEFVTVIFVVLKSLYTGHTPEKDELETLEKNIEDLLNAIDIIVEELNQVNEAYDIQNSVSWSNWISKYWWVPPVTAFTIAIKLSYYFLMQT